MNIQKLKLGQKLWYPYSHDSFSGPHEVKAIGLELPSSVKIEFYKNDECWVDAKDVFQTKREAQTNWKH